MFPVENNEVGEKIRELRKNAGLTQQELAKKTGIIQSDLSRMESGEYRVSLVALTKILGALDMTVSEFFGEGSPVGSVEAALIDAVRRLNSETRAVVLKKARKRDTGKIA